MTREWTDFRRLTSGGGLRAAGLDEAAPAHAVGGARRLSRMMGFRLRRRHAAPTADTTRAAMPMLPPEVQAAIRARLRDEDDPARVLDRGKLDPLSGAPAATSPPPYLFVVRAGEVLTFNSLRTLVRARPDLLGVVFDRRWRDERRGLQPAAALERRRAQRRRPRPVASWVEQGFVLVSPLTPSPAPDADLAPRSDDVRPPAPSPARVAATAWAPAPATSPARQPVEPSAPVSIVASAAPAAPARVPASAAPVRASRVPAPTAIPALPSADPPRQTAPGTVQVAAATRPATTPARRSSADRPPRPARDRRTRVGRLGVGLVAASVALAVFYLGSPNRLAEISERAPRVEPVSAPAPVTDLERPPPPSPALLAAGPDVPAPPASPPARRDRRATAARSAEPSGAARAPLKPCIAPAAPTVAVQDGVILGAVVGAKPDTGARPPRCLFVVKRVDGSYRMVDASQVEARPGSDSFVSRAASEK